MADLKEKKKGGGGLAQNKKMGQPVLRGGDDEGTVVDRGRRWAKLVRYSDYVVGEKRWKKKLKMKGGEETTSSPKGRTQGGVGKN